MKPTIYSLFFIFQECIQFGKYPEQQEGDHIDHMNCYCLVFIRQASGSRGIWINNLLQIWILTFLNTQCGSNIIRFFRFKELLWNLKCTVCILLKSLDKFDNLKSLCTHIFISNQLFSYFRNAPFQSVAFIFSLLQFNRKRLKQQGDHHTKENPTAQWHSKHRCRLQSGAEPQCRRRSVAATASAPSDDFATAATDSSEPLLLRL